MTNFFCNKRYDISFEEFYKLIKLCKPTNFDMRETRGLYRSDFQPCNIIALKSNNPQDIDTPEQCIYCWLGQKGLTVLADTELTVSLCIEVLKNIQQNPEDYKILAYETDKITSETFETDDNLTSNYLVYRQTNSSDDTKKYLVREYNGDEVQVDFYSNPSTIRISGAVSSLLTFVQLLIEKYINA